jgi:hypothetical protein
MLSPGEVAKIAVNLSQLDLGPITYFRVVCAIAARWFGLTPQPGLPAGSRLTG